MGAILFEQQSAAVTASGVSPTLEMGALEFIAADINCTAVAGGGTLTFFIERLGADGVWYQVWAPTAISGAGATSTSIGPGCPTNAVLTGQVRARWVISGTSVTYSVSIFAR